MENRVASDNFLAKAPQKSQRFDTGRHDAGPRALSSSPRRPARPISRGPSGALRKTVDRQTPRCSIPSRRRAPPSRPSSLRSKTIRAAQCLRTAVRTTTRQRQPWPDRRPDLPHLSRHRRDHISPFARPRLGGRRVFFAWRPGNALGGLHSPHRHRRISQYADPISDAGFFRVAWDRRHLSHTGAAA